MSTNGCHKTVSTRDNEVATTVPGDGLHKSGRMQTFQRLADDLLDVHDWPCRSTSPSGSAYSTRSSLQFPTVAKLSYDADDCTALWVAQGMGILSWLFDEDSVKTRRYCAVDFKQRWEAFVDHFVDGIHARDRPGRPPSSPPPDLVSQLPAVERLIAIGDLHGDLEKTQRAFRLAGLTDERHRWIGGTTVCVQVGDQLDRGDLEIPILYFLERLQQEADESGGALHVMNGNHETMNIAGRFRYATSKGLHHFVRWNLIQSVGQSMKRQCGCQAGHSESGNVDGYPEGYGPPRESMARWAALRSGGPFTRRFMARHPTVLKVGSTVFAHGGLLPHHLDVGADAINKGTQEWMLGQSPKPPPYLTGRNAVVWTRQYSVEDREDCKCETLKQVLDHLGAERMIVGHTIQPQGINSACDGRVIRVDVGMSKGCIDGEVQVLEILKDKEVRILSYDRNGRTRAEELEQTELPLEAMFA